MTGFAVVAILLLAMSNAQLFLSQHTALMDVLTQLGECGFLLRPTVSLFFFFFFFSFLFSPQWCYVATQVAARLDVLDFQTHNHVQAMRHVATTISSSCETKTTQKATQQTYQNHLLEIWIISNYRAQFLHPLAR
jgi:hypothetical protein